jgi:protein-disulfide isomerase
MKNVLLAIGMAAVALSASAATPADTATLKSYAARALPRCSGQTLTLTPIPQQGPLNFDLFEVKVTSSDPNCGSQKLVLFSPATKQVLIGNVFPLPTDGRPVEHRVAEVSTRLLDKPMTATVSAFPLPDGLRQTSMTRQTPYGPFSYHGYVDGSNRFLIVASRGNLNTDAGATLLEALGAKTNGVTRGNKASKAEIVELSDYECPTCARAHKALEPIITKYLKNVRYTRIDLPLFEHHEWSVYAALGGRAISKVAPSKYWTYTNYVFENQETIGKMKFDTVLQNFCEDHDIDWKAVQKIYTSDAEKRTLMEQVSRAFDNGIVSTPTYIVNGQLIGFGPEGKFTIDAVKAALGAK